MYRPTVRYDDRFRDYMKDLFHATNLDRNQIFRLSLFLLGHTQEGKDFLSQHLKQGCPLPLPKWGISDHGLVMDSWVDTLEEGKDVMAFEGKDAQPESNIEKGGTSHASKENQGTRLQTASPRPVTNMEGWTREIPRQQGQVYIQPQQPFIQRTKGGGLKVTIK